MIGFKWMCIQIYNSSTNLLIVLITISLRGAGMVEGSKALDLTWAGTFARHVSRGFDSHPVPPKRFPSCEERDGRCMTKLAATRTDRPRGRRFEPGWPENVFKKQGEELSTSCEVLLGWNGDSNRGLEAARSEDRKEELSTPCEILLGAERGFEPGLDWPWKAAKERRHQNQRDKTAEASKQAGWERHPTAPEERLEPGTRPHQKQCCIQYAFDHMMCVEQSKARPRRVRASCAYGK